VLVGRGRSASDYAYLLRIKISQLLAQFLRNAVA
jgi:hypothetical protein